METEETFLLLLTAKCLWRNELNLKFSTKTCVDLQWCGHVRRMSEERITKLIMEWVPLERRKRGHSRKTWMEAEQAAMTTVNLETDQWRNREGWRLVWGRRRQLL